MAYTNNKPSLYTANMERKYLNAAERLRFLMMAEEAGDTDPYVKTLCEVLAYTGCRISESLALTSDSIDLSSATIAIASLKKRGNRQVREVHIPRRILANLNYIHQIDYQQRQGTIAPLWSWSRQTAWRKVKAVMHSARITGVKATCHGLRHTFGVTATRAGIQTHILQRWMGHASMATTAIYADVSGPDDRSLIERMWDGGDPEPPTTPPYMPAHMRQALDKVRDISVGRHGECVNTAPIRPNSKQLCQIIHIEDAMLKRALAKFDLTPELT